MELGTLLPTYSTGDKKIPAWAITSWAVRTEEEGFSSTWAFDHLVKPKQSSSSGLDPLVALGYAAAVTDRIGLGTSILLVPQRRTVQIAHAVTTLLHLAPNRALRLGVGAGYVDKEFEAVGVPKAERGPRLTEAIQVLERLFDGTASFDGRFHSFDDVRIDPVPNDPPQILVGGKSAVTDAGERRFPKAVLDRIVATRGWIAAPAQPDQVAEEWAMIADHARDAGVDPDEIDRALFNNVYLVEGDDREEVLREQRRVFEDYYEPVRGWPYAEEFALVGTIDEITQQLGACADMGFDHAVLGSANRDPAALNRQIDLMADHVLPAV